MKEDDLDVMLLRVISRPGFLSTSFWLVKVMAFMFVAFCTIPLLGRMPSFGDTTFFVTWSHILRLVIIVVARHFLLFFVVLFFVF